MPIREEFFAIPPKPRGSVVSVLITGGSQGSRTLNRAAEESWPLWDRARIRLIHQIGSRMYSELAPKFNESSMPGEVAEFLTDMPRAFSEADVVVSRAGMGAAARTFAKPVAARRAADVLETVAAKSTISEAIDTR